MNNELESKLGRKSEELQSKRKECDSIYAELESIRKEEGVRSSEKGEIENFYAEREKLFVT